jgi:hypothetical protein
MSKTHAAEAAEEPVTDAVRHPIHEQMVRKPKLDRCPVAVAERPVELSDHP